MNDQASGNEAGQLDAEATTTCRPFVKWAGGKGQLLSELLRRVPKTFRSYYEPFVGGGALFFALQPNAAFLSDITTDLVITYKVIRDQVDELVIDLKKHVYDRDYFKRIRAVDRTPEYANWSEVQRASRLIYLNKSCFNGLYRLSSKGFFNTPFGRYANPKILDEANLRACSEVLKGVELANCSFMDIEERVSEGDFIYFDPPYVPLSKTSNFTSYNQTKFLEAMQQQLFDLCVRLDSKGVKFMLSNSSNPWVLKNYSRFQLEVVQAARAINSKGSQRGKIVEVLVTNYTY